MRFYLCFYLYILTLFIGLTAHAAAPDLLTQIGAQIEQHAVVSAEFTQNKQMSALKRPLVTTGRFVFSRQHGVLWQIEQPYRMSYVLGAEQIIEIAADGSRRERGMRDLPGLAQVGKVFRAILGADATALREVFEVEVKGDPAQWEIVLKPRQAQLAQFLIGLKLSGGRFVDSIRIDEAGSDSTHIRFRNPQSATAPGAAELKLFGAPGKP